MSKRFYYAVWNGRKIGIYTSWEDCKRNVSNYSNAGYQKFATYREAQRKLKEELKKVGKEPPPEDSFEFPSLNF
jgi:ribonuclease HI